MSPPASRPLGPAFVLVALLAPSLPLSAADPPPAKPAPRLDAYGDLLPPGAVARLGSVRFRHGVQINCVTWSGDGKVLATSAPDHVLSVWDLATGKELRRIEHPDWYARSFALSADGKRLASAGSSGTVRLWDVSTGKQLLVFKTEQEAGRVTFSPNGKLLANAGGGLGIVRETATGKELYRLDCDGAIVGAIAFSPAGKTLAHGVQHGGIALVDTASGVEEQRLRAIPKVQGAWRFPPTGRCWPRAALTS